MILCLFLAASFLFRRILFFATDLLSRMKVVGFLIRSFNVNYYYYVIVRIIVVGLVIGRCCSWWDYCSGRKNGSWLYCLWKSLITVAISFVTVVILARIFVFLGLCFVVIGLVSFWAAFLGWLCLFWVPVILLLGLVW